MPGSLPTRIERAVFDASPLIFLDALGYVALLESLYGVVIPPAVAAELLAQPEEAGGKVPDLPWITSEAPKAATVQRVREELGADLGEEEAVALALDLSALLVSDDGKARAYAETIGLRLTGTLGILLGLHRLGLSARTLTEDLEGLKSAGMYLSPALENLILKNR
jgi:uncharacterized protein